MVFILSFLIPYHYDPLPLFYQNSLVLFSILVLFVYKKSVVIDIFSIMVATFLLLLYIIDFYTKNGINDSSLIFIFSSVIGLSSYILGKSYQNDTEELDLFPIAFIVVSVLLFLLQLAQFYHIDSSFIKYIQANSDRYYSNIGQPNILATIYVTALATSYVKINNNHLNFILAVLLTIGIFLTKSRVGYISLVIVSLLLFCFDAKTIKNLFKNLIAIILLLILFIINSLQTSNFAKANRLESFGNGRKELYLDSIQLIKDKPLLGYGWEEAHKFVPKAGTINFKNPLYSYHNIFLDLALSYGLIITILIIIFVFLFIYKNNINKYYVVIILPFAIHSLFEFPYYYWYLSIPFFFLLGIINKNLLSENIIFINKKGILPIILMVCLVYKFFYSEYEVISSNYKGVIYQECRNLPNREYYFFKEKIEVINYFCLDETEIIKKKRIVENIFNYNNLLNYIDKYANEDDELEKYACERYNYSCTGK